MICILPTGVIGQKLTTKLADKSFNEFGYMEAIQFYEYAYEKDTSDIYIVKQLAEANHHIGNTGQVEHWLKKLIDRHQEQPQDIFNYFQSLKSNGKYLLAQHWLKEYSALRPNNIQLTMQDSMLQYIHLLKRDSVNYRILNVSLNTKGSDIGPAFYKDQLIFSSTSIGNNSGVNYKWNDLPYLHLYSAKIDPFTGDLTSPEPFAPKLKTAYHDGPVSFDPKNKLIYFTRNNFVKGHTSKSKKGIVNLKIFLGKLEGDQWKLTGAFPYNSDEYSVGHPSIDTSGTTLYFASDMPGGYGKSDLYSSVLTNGQWSKPLNLGPEINTDGNEFFPFISNDGALYFASDGHGGLGGLDIYSSVPVAGGFNEIHNMGYPVNSAQDDFGLALDSTGLKGYFSSNRSEGKGDDDLYFLAINKIHPVIIRGIIRDIDTKDVLANAAVSVVDETGKTILTSITSKDGQFEFEVPKGTQYSLKVTKELYNDNKSPFEALAPPVNDEVYFEIFLEHKIQKQAEPVIALVNLKQEAVVQPKVIEFENINYGFNKSAIRKDAAVILDKLIATMKEFPTLKIRIESYTDSRGSGKYNMQLSKKRARSANSYIVSKGIDPHRLRHKGYGETRLLNKCAKGIVCSKAEHQVNRRSTMTVVSMGL